MGTSAKWFAEPFWIAFLGENRVEPGHILSSEWGPNIQSCKEVLPSSICWFVHPVNVSSI